MRGRRGALLALVLLVAPALAADEPTALVAAASNLRHALPELARAYTEASGRALRLSYGASGNITRQIIQGAPYELFLSADADYVAQLAARGLTEDAGADYAVGRLVLFVARDSGIDPAAGLPGLEQAYRRGALRRLAIASPEHAPYGRAARAALVDARVWETVQPALVFGENVAQAARFVASGAAQAGLIPLALARAPEIARRGEAVLVPAHSHPPLRQRMVLMKGAGASARGFRDFVLSEPACAILVRHGFAPPAASP